MYDTIKPPAAITHVDAIEYFILGLHDAHYAQGVQEKGGEPKVVLAGVCFLVARAVEKLLKALIIHKANAIPWRRPDHHIRPLIIRLAALGLQLPQDLDQIIDLQACSVDVAYHINAVDGLTFTTTDLMVLLERFVGWAQIVA